MGRYMPPQLCDHYRIVTAPGYLYTLALENVNMNILDLGNAMQWHVPSSP